MPRDRRVGGRARRPRTCGAGPRTALGAESCRDIAGVRGAATRRGRLHAAVRHPAAPRPLRVPARSSTRRSSRCRSSSSRPEVAIANVRRSRRRASRGPRRHARPRAEITCARCRWQAAAVYVPGGRAPYPSTVVMGVVTARAAGVRRRRRGAPPGPDGEIDPVDPRHRRLCGVDEVYRSAARRRSPRSPTGPRRSRRSR